MTSKETGVEARRRHRKARNPLRVLVVRHGIAKDQKEFAQKGVPDAERPLTQEGRRRMRRAARGLTALVRDVGAVATSPLTRAVQTAEILVARYAKIGIDVQSLRLSALAPGKPGNLLLNWLDEQPRGHVTVLVGHEPHLGQFVSWALTGLRDSFVDLKKGGAILLEFGDEVRAGRAKLVWSLRPGHLRTIGGATED